MLPEISRRCLSCGAAVRAGSRFCPQCGNRFEAEAAPPPAAVEREAVPPTGESARPLEEKAAPPTKDWTPPTKEFAAFVQSPEAGAPPPASDAPLPAAAEAFEAGPESPAASETEAREEEAEEEASEEAGRAGDLRGRVARVREGTRARVGRMREEAIVVLEETPDDSGLRFVLAAAALFVLFLVLLFLSTTVLR
ncbi:MAG TPA: zinc ribbon domain-containing protein [Pyrinomonadaceae bacterium]|nr:zinc ribbon domain-containing protein [Pyrinomonadaceae bacterium]